MKNLIVAIVSAILLIATIMVGIGIAGQNDGVPAPFIEHCQITKQMAFMIMLEYQTNGMTKDEALRIGSGLDSNVLWNDLVEFVYVSPKLPASMGQAAIEGQVSQFADIMYNDCMSVAKEIFGIEKESIIAKY